MSDPATNPYHPQNMPILCSLEATVVLIGAWMCLLNVWYFLLWWIGDPMLCVSCVGISLFVVSMIYAIR